MNKGQMLLKIKKRVVTTRGFTMVELVVVIVVLAILSAVGIISFRATMPNRNLAKEARNIYSTIQRAKAEAVKRKSCVIITYTDSTSGLPQKYIAFLDNGAGGGVACDKTKNGAEEQIASSPSLADGIDMLVNIGGAKTLCISSMGTVCGGQSGFVQVQTRASDGSLGRILKNTVSAGGGVRLERSDDFGATWSN